MALRLDMINLGTVWAILAGCVAGVVFIFTEFARAEDVNKKFESLELDLAYGQYYDRLDDYDEAVDEGNQQLAAEYLRQMERLRATICEHDPEWERCDD
jgi:hypothetical protein